MTEFGQFSAKWENGSVVVLTADNNILVSDELLRCFMGLEPGDNIEVGEYKYRHVSEQSPGVHWYQRLDSQ